MNVPPYLGVKFWCKECRLKSRDYITIFHRVTSPGVINYKNNWFGMLPWTEVTPSNLYYVKILATINLNLGLPICLSTVSSAADLFFREVALECRSVRARFDTLHIYLSQ